MTTKMKFKKIEDGYPSDDRDVMVLLNDNTMSVGYYSERTGSMRPVNVYVEHNAYGGSGYVEFDSSVIAWAELPEVEYE